MWCDYMDRLIAIYDNIEHLADELKEKKGKR